MTTWVTTLARIRAMSSLSARKELRQNGCCIHGPSRRLTYMPGSNCSERMVRSMGAVRVRR
jgi:hypothetical protein